MPLLSEVLAGMGEQFRRALNISDDDCRTKCPKCGTLQSVGQATVDQTDPMETTYRCREGCGGILLIIATPELLPWEGRGYRIGAWVIRNPEDLTLTHKGMPREVLIPKSPEALS